MTSPYDAIAGAEVLFYLAAVLITIPSLTAILAAWVYWSGNKMVAWYGSIRDSMDSGRWVSILVPHRDDLGDVFWFIVVGAINALIVAAGLFVLGWVVYVV